MADKELEEYIRIRTGIIHHMVVTASLSHRGTQGGVDLSACKPVGILSLASYIIYIYIHRTSHGYGSRHVCPYLLVASLSVSSHWPRQVSTVQETHRLRIINVSVFVSCESFYCLVSPDTCDDVHSSLRHIPWPTHISLPNVVQVLSRMPDLRSSTHRNAAHNLHLSGAIVLP